MTECLRVLVKQTTLPSPGCIGVYASVLRAVLPKLRRCPRPQEKDARSDLGGLLEHRDFKAKLESLRTVPDPVGEYKALVTIVKQLIVVLPGQTASSKLAAILRLTPNHTNLDPLYGELPPPVDIPSGTKILKDCKPLKLKGDSSLVIDGRVLPKLVEFLSESSSKRLDLDTVSITLITAWTEVLMKLSEPWRVKVPQAFLAKLREVLRLENDGEHVKDRLTVAYTALCLLVRRQYLTLTAPNAGQEGDWMTEDLFSAVSKLVRFLDNNAVYAIGSIRLAIEDYVAAVEKLPSTVAFIPTGGEPPPIGVLMKRYRKYLNRRMDAHRAIPIEVVLGHYAELPASSWKGLDDHAPGGAGMTQPLRIGASREENECA